MILVDTSAWIDFLRGTPGGATTEVRKLLAEEPSRVVMCEPVASELLAGPTRDEVINQLELLVNGLPSLDFDPLTEFRTAASLYRAARRSGRTVRSLNDCVIAAVALRHGATVLHKDSDYDVLASVSRLDVHSLL